MTVRELHDPDNSETPPRSSGWRLVAAFGVIAIVGIATLVVGPLRWHGLSTREWATVFWASVLVVAGVAHPGIRSDVAKFLRSLPRFWKVFVAILAVAGWTVVVVYLGYRLDAWNRDLLKDTIVWFLFYGFAAVFSATRAAKEDRYFRRAFLSALSLTALMQFLLNLHTFHIAVEFVLQPVVTFLLTLGAVAALEPRTITVKKLADWLLAIIGLWVVIGTVHGLWQSWRGIDPKQTGLAFAFSIWLPLAMLPFVYVLALTMTYGTTFRLTSFKNDGRKPPLSVRAAVVYGLHGNLRAVNDLPQHPRQYRAISRSRGFREALRHVREYQWERDHRRQEEEIDAARLDWYAGDKGKRADGTLLDQREFEETRDALRWVLICHLGHHNNLGHYRTDLMEVLGDFTRQGLPQDHGITMRVQKDRQAWYAWRRTPSGYVLGIGADNGRANEWLYEGWKPPDGFPGEDSLWGVAPFETPPNWR
jgi:hypothetical protein